jgi:hypothetical protein
VAMAMSTAHGWSPTSQTMSPGDMAAVLRSAAARVEAAGATAQPLGNADLAALLRQASDAASRAAAAAEAGTLAPGGLPSSPAAMPSAPPMPSATGLSAPSIPPSILSGSPPPRPPAGPPPPGPGSVSG